MTNKDKVKGVLMALADTELSKLTQQEIADLIGVTREAVNRISRRDTLDKNRDESPGEPEDNTPDNHRPTKTPPTQAEVERGELRQAIGLIKALPYGGADTGKLALVEADIVDLEYVSEWAAHAVLEYRSK